MPPTPLDVAKAEIEALKASLARTPPEHKKECIGVGTAQTFNRIIDKLKTEMPDMAPNLTKLRYGDSLALHVKGKAEPSFLDLELEVERVLGLILLYQKG